MAPEAEQLRLLLVDDEPKLTEFLRMELEVEGYAVQIAHDEPTTTGQAAGVQPQAGEEDPGAALETLR